uniref:Uncharacterized protein n=1 Tax=Candidatus Kentrum sp. UNK TaxID=2126344 RepID=A0A451AJ57_9GAMM|nr:MAG: hypothetical protein BECKUNK1418G_GA0071005_107814 [Candidatus Kentron sp. UNK]VFK69384.1 MAG: hypothetical protein BECKUNK1418H_GA0071006_101315 [Candidatus Kentron sp. UNK]
MTANLSREQELAFWREKTEQLRARIVMETKQPADRKSIPSP